MKTLLLFLLLCSSALADNAWQGLRPAVTKTELPSYVSDAIRDRLDNPASMEIVGWTIPTLETWSSAGQQRGKWNMRVSVRATNKYGGVVTGVWSVSIRKEAVLFCSQLR